MSFDTALPSLARLRDRLARRRRLVAAVLVGVAVLAGVSAARPAAPPTQRVWSAARDLPGGVALAGGDLRARRLPVADVPAGALLASTSVTGRLLAAPVRRGEPLTDVRLLSPALLAAQDDPSDVAVPVRVADGQATSALVHTGDLIDVLATPTSDSGAPGRAAAVATDVRVLAVPAAAADADSTDGAGLVVVAATPAQATALAQAAAGDQLSVTVHRQPP